MLLLGEKQGGIRHRALYAIVQAWSTFENRGDTDWDHTIFPGSDARADERGPEQRYAVEAIEVTGRLLRNNRATSRWIPAHQGAEGNEVAGEWAKAVAKSVCDSVPGTSPRETSLASVSRSITEERTKGTVK